MKITKEAQAQARRLMRLCMGADGRLQEDNVRRVATTLCTEKPRNYLAILKSFTDMVRVEVQRHTATITTARPVLETEKAAIRAKLDARHPGLHYEWLTDPNLIAGMTVKVGDNVTDASVRSRIERLEKLIS